MTHIILDHGDHIVLSRDDRPVGEGEESIDMIATDQDVACELMTDRECGVQYVGCAGGDGAYELIVDEDGCSERFGSENMSDSEDGGGEKRERRTKPAIDREVHSCLGSGCIEMATEEDMTFTTVEAVTLVQPRASNSVTTHNS